MQWLTFTQRQTYCQSRSHIYTYTALWSMLALRLWWLTVTEEGAWLTPSGSPQCSLLSLRVLPPVTQARPPTRTLLMYHIIRRTCCAHVNRLHVTYFSSYASSLYHHPSTHYLTHLLLSPGYRVKAGVYHMSHTHTIHSPNQPEHACFWSVKGHRHGDNMQNPHRKAQDQDSNPGPSLFSLTSASKKKKDKISKLLLTENLQITREEKWTQAESFIHVRWKVSDRCQHFQGSYHKMLVNRIELKII